jgi:DNA-binding LytR/AlgR family response regulator
MDENGEIRLTIQLDDLLYIEASENYVTIHYLDQFQPGRMLLRNSMKKMEEQLAEFPVIRCHRSYMVNLSRVSIARKEKAGLQLHLNAPVKMVVPVSDSYRDGLLDRFRNA